MAARTETDYYTLRSAESANDWFNRFEGFRRPIDEYARGAVRAGNRAKVAILDTGINISNEKKIPENEKKRIKGLRSFLPDGLPDDASDSDSRHHGTQIAALLLKQAPFAEVYIARIKKDESSPLHPESVAEALGYATDEWDVDIISMSWGFTSEYAIVADAIHRAFEKGKVMFVAASNTGANLPKEIEVTFPATMPEVICINSSDGYGQVSNFNPPPRNGKYNFSTLGEAVMDVWDSETSRKRESGTSFATPLAAAIAASFIEFARQGKFGKFKMTDQLKKEVRTRDGMLKILMAISRESQGFNYLQPWNLLRCTSEPGKCPDRCMRARETAGRKISRIVQDALLSPADMETNARAPMLLHAVAADVRSLVHEYQPTCLASTRVDLRRQIDAWVSGSPAACICWISGRLGTGKSTLARTIALQYSEEGRLGATFCFSKNEADVKTSAKFVSSLAHQLGLLSPSLKLSMAKEKRDNPEVEQLAMRTQWEKLIRRPLSHFEFGDNTIIIVIDALDECEDLDKVKIMGILNLFVSTAALKNVQVRFLITSRPESYIQSAFKDISQEVNHIVLDEVDKATVDQDVSRLLHNELSKVHIEMDAVGAHWFSDEMATKLTEKANGLFIYAATVCRYIKGSDRDKTISLKERLVRIFQGQGSDTLDDMYDYILTQAVIGREEEALRKQLRMVLGVVVALFDPFPEAYLGEICPEKLEPDVVSSRLDPLRSVLVVPRSEKDPVHISHQSFREFLLERREIWINEQAHRDLFTTCIRTLSKDPKYRLRRDICGISHPGIEISRIEQTKIEDSCAFPTRYACRHWIDHLNELDPSQRGDVGLEDYGEVHLFLQNHLLHWLEALSLLGATFEAVRAIRMLGSMIDPDESPLIYDFVKDAERFILHHRAIIEKAPLQVYCSALVFAPQQSLVRQVFAQEMPHWITKLPKVQTRWTLLRQTLEPVDGVKRTIGFGEKLALVFSHDGDLLVSISEYASTNISQVWAARTGILLNTMESKFPVAFSPKSKLVALVNCDWDIELLDAASGAVTRVIKVKGEEDQKIDALSFSPDGSRVIMAMGEGQVHLWDAGTGSRLRTYALVAGGRQERISCYRWVLSCSSDNTTIVTSCRFLITTSIEKSKAWRSRMSVWRADDALVLYTSETCESCSFSPDGKLLAFISSRKAHVLDVAKHSMLYTIDDCALAVFSPDGKLATADAQVNELHLRVGATGKQVGVTLSLKAEFRSKIVFSPDGKLLAVFHQDEGRARTLPLWNVATGEPVGDFEDSHIDCIITTFSPDSTVMASGSKSGVVRLWDIPPQTAPAPVAARQSHQLDKYWDAKFVAVTVSPDKKLVASGGRHNRLQIWDATTAALLRETRHYLSEGMIAFSPNSKVLLASVLGLRAFDVATLKRLHIFDYRSCPVTALEFSPSGGMIAAAFDEWKSERRIIDVQLYNSRNGQKLRSLERHLSPVTAIAFSSDGKHVATADTSLVQISDVITGTVLKSFSRTEISRPRALAFSTNEDALLLLGDIKRDRAWQVQLLEIKKNKTIHELDHCVASQLLSGNTKDGVILTESGPLRLPTAAGGTDSVESPIPKAGVVPLYTDGNWVTYDGCNVLWLPHAYRPTSAVVNGQVLAFGTRTGEILFIEFDISRIPKRQGV